MSCVADVKPNNTANTAMAVSAAPPAEGSVSAMPTIEPTTPNCASSKYARRRPNRLVSMGSGSRSTKGAHTNLNEYPSAAQLKNVTARRSTPASMSHSESDEKINKIGTPAENPSSSMMSTRRSHTARSVSNHVGAVLAVGSAEAGVETSMAPIVPTKSAYH